MEKLRVAVLCGGQSAEHEVSLQSALNIINALDRDRYDILVIGIDKEGRWFAYEQAEDFLEHPEDPKLISLKEGGQQISLVPGDREGPFRDLSGDVSLGKIDVVFPVLHGPYGEDGTMQGLLKILHVPFCGVGVLGSAAGMDKDVTKRLLRDAGIPIAKFMVLERGAGEVDFEEVRKTLGSPCFVKPANLGSSVGIERVGDEAAFKAAVEEAFRWDQKVLIEETLTGREIECSVLGNEDPIASLPGEIITDPERYTFYSYEAKYIDGKGATLEIPAKVSEEVVQRIKDLAVRSFQALCCEGMARVDFFLLEDGRIIVNELNTIPGFTKISMYPKLWEISGIPYGELIDRLIRLALERDRREKELKTALG
ncbi:MAG: D-alanine--D-alanine ligase [Deltaproteobacteria bacterium]|nr:D-alanine--D-alanine ligase [Deltaproteobacteria bacterium]MBW2016896.1 D-alanine--D-alanine ligase [Deltaproteobacteria bacterium]MBW2128479.1 D-alanine--D-alanine ligase [Deltaproteobacteria bacterium]MBW2303662.1 D-alanine--D-alanine ligase [Deltaproteobacteria bacterium]